ncbi:hypothetical protein ACJIZ3_009356 [Penstemon smallii]|uniref:Bifunctional inhibitor/plant lipid transfer protein/seed storage helical domain-containing protein n=1 Tax=Penstemon smallii TaxID=265156 RepID=A0ABD3TCA0_9LAMI
MSLKTTSITTVFISTNLLCYVLAANISPLSPTPFHGGNSGNATLGLTHATCPIDAVKLGLCAKLLSELVGVVVGTPPAAPCCTVLAGLVDLEAAVCLCTVIKANVLGISLNVPVSLSLLLNVCGKTLPSGFICA